MKSLHIFWLFYRRLVAPTWATSISLGLVSGHKAMQTTGIALVFLGALFQYFVYELRFPREYFYYYNLGWSKPKLWAATSLFHILCTLTFIAV